MLAEKGPVKRLKPELIKSVAFSPYLSGFGYCSSCERWVLLSQAPRSRNGYPICPHCHQPLRLKPRSNRSRRKPLWSGDWLPGCYGFFGSPVEPWICEACPVSEVCRGEKRE